jgi:1-deoxy-D-xylulose-5-phosphate reductoisomerase
MVIMKATSEATSVRHVTILGSTGSIGESTLDVIRRHPQLYTVYALTANTQVEKLAAQCREFRPAVAVVGTAAAAQQLTSLLHCDGLSTHVVYGPEALVAVAADPASDTVMAAIVGAAGLPAAMASACAGKRVLLANKEALVMSGHLFMQAVRDSGATLLPIDSEHNAIFQSLPAHHPVYGAHVEKIILTASGGPFRTRTLDTLHAVTPDEACAHPNWVMGRKISVDSASMMNKGLEVIEAHWLFGAPASAIEVLIHPQSIVHSMVSYRDGSVIAQLGNPDMRTPIAYGLAHPERIDAGVNPLELARCGALTFETPDLDRFPCLGLAYEAMRAGGASPAILNAANEVAVDAFLDGGLRFTDIPDLITHTLDQCCVAAPISLDDVLEADRVARACARRVLADRYVT